MTTLYGAIASYNPSKSFLWYGKIFSRASSLSSSVVAQIIFLKLNILSFSKNMCSVRQSPIPSAPNFRAWMASLGVSALVLTRKSLALSAHDINVSKSPLIDASSISSFPAYTLPVEPSIDK